MLTVRSSMQTFQSRNRGSFDFKVIKSLPAVPFKTPFQSRNRGSFDFKKSQTEVAILEKSSFNLVIEVLLISR